MAGENINSGVNSEILKYLKEEGPTNTFRLTRMMGLERNKLLTIIGKLEEKEAVKCERGNVIFLKFLSTEKPVKAVAPLLSLPEQQKNEQAAARTPAKRKLAKPPVKSKALLLLQAENKQLQQKVWRLGETVKELEEKASAAPKTITRTVTKSIIKKVPVVKTIIKKVPVTKTVIKRVPITKTVIKLVPVTKTVIRKIRVPAPLPRISVPAPRAESRFWEKLVTHSEQFTEQFKDSGFKLLDNMKQLKEPEFMRHL